MSFRTRLTLFFVLIVVVPMIALGVVVSRLVVESERGKAGAQNRASAAAAVAGYERIAQRNARHARELAADDELAAALAAGDRRAARQRARELAGLLGLARVRILRANRLHSDLGDPEAIAAGSARLRPTGGGDQPGAPPHTIEASTLTADRFARNTSVAGVSAVVRRDGALLASTLPAAALRDTAQEQLPQRGTVTLGGVEYTVSTFRGEDFGGRSTTVVVLTDTSGAASAATRGQWIAVGLLALFLVLAFAGALLISRQLHGQLERFLAAAKRIGGGDLSTKVPIEGDDEFAALGREFNKMSGELEQRLHELDQERARLRESIERVGATFASNLDRAALLEIGAQTIVDAVEAECGRAIVPAAAGLLEGARVGDISGAEAALAAAETQAREHGQPAAVTLGAISALAAPIARADADGDGEQDPASAGAPHGIVSVARRDRPFTAAERDLVTSLARQTGISLENVDLHEVVQRQAVTDELTGLFNHRRFQEVIAAEAAAARRFGQPLGLLMLDIDDFKQVNDTHGHPQGDLVLREVARVLRDCSREIDEPARYGGEEMAVALQQTDLDGAETIAERVRTAVEALEIPRLDDAGPPLRVTVSCGVASSNAGDPAALIADADAALYAAKRSGKNRTVRAAAAPTAPTAAPTAPAGADEPRS